MIDARAAYGQRLLERERVRVAEGERVPRLLDDDRAAAVRGEVHVVWVRDRDVGAGAAAGVRVDRGQAVADVVGRVERAQVPRGHDVLDDRSRAEVADDPEGPGVDHVHAVVL